MEGRNGKRRQNLERREYCTYDVGFGVVNLVNFAIRLLQFIPFLYLLLSPSDILVKVQLMILFDA